VATSSDLITYRDEIFAFLDSLTIKFSPLIAYDNALVESRGYPVDVVDPTTWKTYLNLVGDYHPTDTLMTILSMDTQETIDFTKASLAVHPLTAESYRPGQPAYQALCEKYPDQTALIRNIVHPVASIEAAIAAEDFEILAYGEGYLELDELQSVLDALKKFLDFTARRWYMSWLDYEPYYTPAFWASLWPQLYACISVTRITNIHTASVHSFHVWEYLKSHGLGDYRDVLTRRQTMFLYRNIRYLLQNRGRGDTLVLLANELLIDPNIAIVGKTIRQQTVTAADQCRWVPEFISVPVETQFSTAAGTQAPETVEDIQFQLEDIGVAPRASAEEIDRITRQLGGTTTNVLPTKLLELQMVTGDRKYAEIASNFIMDTLVKMVASDQYLYTFTYVDETTKQSIDLSTKDLLALLYLANYRSHGVVAVDLPVHYTPIHGAFRTELTVDDLPATVAYDGVAWPVSAFVDRETFIRDARPPLATVISPERFGEACGLMFTAYVRMIATVRFSADTVADYVLRKLMNASLDRATLDLQLSEHATYADWLADPAHHDIATFVALTDARDDARERYEKLSSALIQMIAPRDNEYFRPYLNYDSDSTLYTRLKELFVQLCSYNILFLDTEQTLVRSELLPSITMELTSSELDVTMQARPDLDITGTFETIYQGYHTVDDGNGDQVATELAYAVDEVMTLNETTLISHEQEITVRDPDILPRIDQSAYEFCELADLTYNADVVITVT
jgi:hypothetical protein